MNDLNRFECVGRLGQDRSTTEIIAAEMQIPGGREDDVEGQEGRQPQAQQMSLVDNVFEDDIPF